VRDIRCDPDMLDKYWSSTAPDLTQAFQRGQSSSTYNAGVTSLRLLRKPTSAGTLKTLKWQKCGP
jgi:hypothetical protein